LKALAPALLAWLAASAGAQSSLTLERSASLGALLSAEEAHALAKTLPVDQEFRFRVRRPAAADRPGVFVFISPTDSGELPPEWAEILDQANLEWIAADGFGNSRPTAQRMLVAVMALNVARRERVDTRRLYLSGLSGGGRVASECVTHFPHLFTGALFMVGANFYLPAETPARELLATRPLVFLTGSRDFNRREMRQVYERYGHAGLARLLLLDVEGFGHERARPEQLRAALQFLDGR
jgi:predicted esterase